MSAPNEVIRTQALCKRFGGVVVADSIDLQLNRGFFGSRLVKLQRAAVTLEKEEVLFAAQEAGLLHFESEASALSGSHP